MQKTSKILIVIIFAQLLSSCINKNVAIKYFTDAKLIKEQRQFFDKNDTSKYEYTSFYRNGLKESQGHIIDSKKEGIWKEWYGDGMLRRELYYVKGELDYENENRRLPEVIFECDSLFFDVENRMKVTNLYPNENIPFAGMHIWRLTNDSCYDYGFIPRSTDSVYIFYFSPIQFSRIDTIFIRDIMTSEEIGFSKEEFERLQKKEPDYMIIKKNNEMIILKQAAVYE